MSKNLVKIKLIFVLSLFTVSCSLQKSLLDEDLILEKTNIKINGNLIKKDSLSDLITFKENSKLLGIPFNAMISSSAKKNPDSIFDEWVNEQKKLNNIFSPKQVLQLKKYFKNFNDWKINNGEKISLIDSSEINKSLDNLNLYFQNIGYLDNSTSFKVAKKPAKKAFVDFIMFDI